MFLYASLNILKIFEKLAPIFFLVSGTRLSSSIVDLLLINIAGVIANMVHAIPI